MSDTDRLLSTSEAAHYLGLDPGTLKRWRTKTGGPPFTKVSANRARYSFESLRAWAAERTRRSASEDRGRAA